MSDVPKYEERYCAFVDILGFRGLIAGLGDGSVQLDTIRKLLSQIHQPHDPRFIGLGDNDFQAQSISDAVAIGIKVKKGDEFVIPPGFLTLSANPLKGSGQFSSHGLNWFAELVFGVDIAKNRDDFTTALRAIIEGNEKFFEHAEYLKGLDLNDPANEEEVFKRISANTKTIEWWGYMAAFFGSIALKAVEEGNASEAAWAMATAERFRALAIFKSNFEEAVFAGQSARRLVDVLRTPRAAFGMHYSLVPTIADE
jgi:hypothetical protein